MAVSDIISTSLNAPFILEGISFLDNMSIWIDAAIDMLYLLIFLCWAIWRSMDLQIFEDKRPSIHPCECNIPDMMSYQNTTSAANIIKVHN